jgi:hypothetical protein
MDSTLLIRDAAALRHTFQVKKRLQLEFLAGLSKLLREYGVKADDELIGSLVLAVPDEMMGGSYMSSAQSAQAANGRRKNGSKAGVGPQPGRQQRGVGPQPGRKGVGPQPGRKPRKGAGVGPQPGPKKGSGKGKK